MPSELRNMSCSAATEDQFGAEAAALTKARTALTVRRHPALGDGAHDLSGGRRVERRVGQQARGVRKGQRL